VIGGLTKEKVALVLALLEEVERDRLATANARGELKFRPCATLVLIAPCYIYS
jgi:hypothetical protein